MLDELLDENAKTHDRLDYLYGFSCTYNDPDDLDTILLSRHIHYHLRHSMAYLSQAAAPDRHIHLKLKSSIEESCLLGQAVSTLAGSEIP